MTEKKSTEDRHKDAYATVGELVLIANALDYQLAEAVICVLNLGKSTMLLPVIITLDAARKIEILKSHAAHISQSEWKKGVLKYVGQVEKVMKLRNTACHMQPIHRDGEWTLRPFAAAKLYKNIDLKKKTIQPVTMRELRDAISTAENTLGTGLNLIENFQRVNAELAIRAATGG